MLFRSDHFKKSIEINPHYRGEKVVLDPYSKITSVWGVLAEAYFTMGKIDSARWCFEKGKKETEKTKDNIRKEFKHIHRSLQRKADNRRKYK